MRLVIGLATWRHLIICFSLFILILFNFSGPTSDYFAFGGPTLGQMPTTKRGNKRTAAAVATDLVTSTASLNHSTDCTASHPNESIPPQTSQAEVATDLVTSTASLNRSTDCTASRPNESATDFPSGGCPPCVDHALDRASQ
jgi:hypothetical protein